jgi:hypothetical protein
MSLSPLSDLTPEPIQRQVKNLFEKTSVESIRSFEQKTRFAFALHLHPNAHSLKI